MQITSQHRGTRGRPCAAVVAAHPDDETVGLGALLPSLHRPIVIHVTDGAPHQRRWWGAPELPSREAYAQARHQELIAALALAGIGEDRLRSLGVRDQEAQCDMADLATRLAKVIVETRCDVVLTHPYEGGHPDHDATTFAVHAACRLLARSGVRAPRIIEFACYHARQDGGEGIATCEFLPAPGVPERVIILDADERERKRRMLAAFATQRRTLAQFSVAVERLRPSPMYDFTAPPHPGTLFYEFFEWGCTGTEWRAHAHDALEKLGMGAEVGC